MSTSRKLLVAQTEEQTPLMLMTSNLEKDLSPSGNADFYVSISSSLVLTVWLMDSQSSTSNKFALFRTFNLQKWLKIETLGLFESQILQDSKLVAVHIIKLNLIIFLRVNPSFHDSENSQGQVFFDRFKIISIPEYLKPYSLQVGEDGLAIGTFNSGSSKIEQYLIPNSIDWSTEDIISALQLENYVEPSGIITNRDELSELKKSQKTEGCSVNQVSILAGQGNYSAEQPETSEKNVSKKKNRTKKKKEGKSLENSQETEKDLHSVLKQDIQPVVTQAIKTTQNTTQTPVVQLKDEKTKPSKENEKKSKTPERTVVQRLNESENQKTKDMTNRDHNSEKSTPVHTKKLMNQNQQNSKNSKQQAKSAKNKKYDPDAFTQSDEYEKVVPKNNQNDAKQKQSQQKIVQEQKSKNEKNDKISDQPKNKIQDSKTSLNSTIQQNQNVSQQNVKNIVVPTINHQSQLSTQGLINHDNQLDLMRELLGNNVESLDSKIQEFYEIVQKSESSKKDQLTKLTEFLANLEKDLLAAVETSMDKNVQDQFRAAFETLVLPVFEKYLSQLFNKTDLMFNRGFKYYANKINIEQNKLDQFKEQLSQVAASFLTTSKSVKAVMQETEIVQKALVKTANDITESQTDLIEKKLEKLESNQDKILTMLEKISSKLETVEKKVDQVENWQVKFSEELSTQQRLKEMQKQSSKEKKSKSSKTGVQPEQKTIEQMLQNTSINHQFSAPTIGTMPYGYGQQIPAQNFQYQNLHQIHATPMMNHLGLHQSNSTQGYLLQNLGHVHPQIPTHQLQPNSIPIRASLNAAELEALYSQQIQQHQHQNSASNLQSKDILDKLSQILEQNKEAKNDTSISSSSEHG